MSNLFKVMAIMAILLGFRYTADAQLGGMLNKAKNKADANSLVTLDSVSIVAPAEAPIPRPSTTTKQ